MRPEVEPVGWAWFEDARPEADDAALDEVCRAAARCLSGADGDLITGHLRRLVLERRLPPEASDAELRHLEGQRWAIAHLLALAARGRA
jgi:hypothetical protein